jgi:hypothetical protein
MTRFEKSIAQRTRRTQRGIGGLPIVLVVVVVVVLDFFGGRGFGARMTRFEKSIAQRDTEGGLGNSPIVLVLVVVVVLDFFGGQDLRASGRNDAILGKASDGRTRSLGVVSRPYLCISLPLLDCGDQ